MSKFRGVKTDNVSSTSKEELRIGALESADNSRVVEFYCGSGKMYEKVWRMADGYVGCDINAFSDERTTYQSDSVEFAKTFDSSGFNVFDIDAYGSPYSVLHELSKKTFDSRELHFILTDGTQIDLRMGKLCIGFRLMLDTDVYLIKNAHKLHDSLIKNVCDSFAARIGRTVKTLRIKKGRTGSGMRYVYFKVSDAE